MAIKYKHRITKKIAEYDSFMGLFYIEGENFKDNGNPIPHSPNEIKNDSNWEYLETELQQKKS